MVDFRNKSGHQQRQEKVRRMAKSDSSYFVGACKLQRDTENPREVSLPEYGGQERKASAGEMGCNPPASIAVGS